MVTTSHDHDLSWELLAHKIFKEFCRNSRTGILRLKLSTIKQRIKYNVHAMVPQIQLFKYTGGNSQHMKHCKAEED